MASLARWFFSGIIASVTGFGFFVRLNDLFIDGLVHVSSLDNDYYRYDNIGQRLIGESSGVVYRLGDTVEIRVEAVHMDERKIDFALVSSSRKPRGADKTERDRAKNGGQRTLRDGSGAGAVRAQAQRKRRGGKPPANFEPDSTFRKDGDKPADTVKKDKKTKVKKTSDKTRKIAAATKAKRATKKKGTE